MNQFLKENESQVPSEADNRVQLLSQKINNLKLGHKADTDKKLNNLEKHMESLENQLELTFSTVHDQYNNIKLIFKKIENELAYDYMGKDVMMKEQIRRCDEMFVEKIEQHCEDRQNNDTRIAKFIDEKCSILRNLIEQESKEKANCGRQIEESLTKDIQTIHLRIEQEKRHRDENIDNIHNQFLKEYNTIREEFSQLCEKLSSSELEFFTMLKDLLKKVKSEINDGRTQREHMESTILLLIEQICDKAIEEISRT